MNEESIGHLIVEAFRTTRTRNIVTIRGKELQIRGIGSPAFGHCVANGFECSRKVIAVRGEQNCGKEKCIVCERD